MSHTVVVGLGLIGGSAALAAGARGFDRDGGVREKARGRGIAVADSLAGALDGAGLVVAAASTAETPALLREIAALAPRAVLTDCASLKRPIADAAASLPEGVRFVAGHPMAGGRGRGVEAADPEIFRGRPWVLVRTARSDAASLAAVESFVRAVGGRPVELDAARHDRAMTWISHLPLAVASALARAAAAGSGDTAALAGPGLIDTTRLASQPESLALELALADPEALARAIDAVSASLDALASSLRSSDREAVRRFFADAAAARRDLAGA
ncbi:MAG TPA: prephenate dehydrogenase/arogenate dehydrogenase family protein [Thermoanaerobaculia bacterium]|nr:prephenate dehydrogenase/arogenate dehydrogenase family protein [Thermoanaerobaculia bacterium]